TTYLHFLPSFLYFFLTTTATTDIYPLSLHDALPILLHGQLSIPDHGARTASPRRSAQRLLGTQLERRRVHRRPAQGSLGQRLRRSEEHTSELQSRENLVCRLLLEKKKTKKKTNKHAV